MLEMLLMLLGAGADPNAQDGGGRTPLHFAADSISSAAIAVLLDAGADPDTRDEYYRTPLHRAACARWTRERPPHCSMPARLARHATTGE